jgi:hypothetical protein
MGRESELVPSTPTSAPGGSLLVGEAREAVVVRQLRGCIKLVVVVGLVVIAFGYLPTEVIGRDYRPHVVRAGSDELTLCTLVMLSAAPWVYQRPRWRRMVAWMLWVASWQLVLVALYDQRHHNYSPGLEQAMIGFLLGVIDFVVGVVMPLVRLTVKYAPSPELPGARVVR